MALVRSRLLTVTQDTTTRASWGYQASVTPGHSFCMLKRVERDARSRTRECSLAEERRGIRNPLFSAEEPLLSTGGRPLRTSRQVWFARQSRNLVDYGTLNPGCSAPFGCSPTPAVGDESQREARPVRDGLGTDASPRRTHASALRLHVRKVRR